MNTEMKSALETIIEVQLNGSTQIQRSQSAQEMPTSSATFPQVTSNNSDRKTNIFNKIKPNSTIKNRPSTAPLSKSVNKIHQIKTIRDKRNPAFSDQIWIPESLRFKELNRNIRLAVENYYESSTLEKTIKHRYQHKYATLLEEEKAQEKIGNTKKQECGCCGQSYYKINLPQSVSLKAIVDIRAIWAGEMKSSNIYSSSNWSQDIFKEGLTKPYSMYDQVRVCVFCAQFFDVQERYRPSYEDLVRAELKHRQDEAAKRIIDYWDPLKMCEKTRDELERENPTYISAHSDTLRQL